MTKEIIVKKSKIQGKGVFANRDFKKGETVLKWNTSHKLTKKEVENLPESEKHYVNSLNGQVFLVQPPERFVNHSCEPNTMAKNGTDLAIRDIKKGEEITGDYTKEEVVEFEFNCKCESKNCKTKITGKLPK